MTKKKDYSKDLQTLLFINLGVLTLMISMFNIYLFSKNEKKASNQNESQVLGIEDNRDYWQSLVEKHPSYIDGWIELDRLDKVNEIDPNYFK